MGESTYLHEVDFEKWCPHCNHADISEIKSPCNECLEHPSNTDSRKPVYFAGSTDWLEDDE